MTRIVAATLTLVCLVACGGNSADTVFHHEARGFQHGAAGVHGIHFPIFYELTQCGHGWLLRPRGLSGLSRLPLPA